jgi:hypothetical protein
MTADRSRGEYWDGLNALAVHGDGEAEETYAEAFLRGHYGIWCADDGSYAGTRLDLAPFLLDRAESNCCTLCTVNSAWQNLFGFESHDVLEADLGWSREAIPHHERLRWWWDLFKDRLVYSKIGRIYVPGPEPK